MTQETIICRCSDISLKELRALISQGYTNFEELKRVSRVGMGPCQGKTCTQMILKELAMATGVSIEELKSGKSRPPVSGVKLGLLAKGELLDEK